MNIADFHLCSSCHLARRGTHHVPEYVPPLSVVVAQATVRCRCVVTRVAARTSAVVNVIVAQRRAALAGVDVRMLTGGGRSNRNDPCPHHGKGCWEQGRRKMILQCVACGSVKDIQADHIVPIANYGNNCGIHNQQPLCRSCNLAKGVSYEIRTA